MTSEPLPTHSALRPGYVPALDGLRAIAVLLVMWGHVPTAQAGYPHWLAVLHAVVTPGELGVEVFFVLSGFLITRILLAERARAQPLRWFLLRRLLRIFPIYYLLLAVVAIVRPGPELPWCVAYLANVYYMTNHANGMLAHTWSLCVEEHFYLLWPVVVGFAPRPTAVRVMAFLIMPAAVVGALVVAACSDQIGMKVVQFGSPFRFLGLGAGCLMAFHELPLAARPRAARWCGLGLMLLGVLLWPVFWVFQAPALLGVGLPPQLAPALWLVHSGTFASGIVLVCLVGATQGSRWVRPLAARVPRAIGRISYGLYLYHLPAYWLVVLAAPTGLRTLAAVALTFALATVSYIVVERPLLQYAARFR